ncbi:putative toxin-antitoxin system toxin component, PIN family [Spirosoma luteolum]
MNGKIPSAAKLVFDTNVLISAFVFRGKARIVYQYCVERYSVFTTEWLLDELQRVLSRPKFGLPVPIQYAILDQVRADAQLVYPFNELPTHSVDPDDNYVLQAALFVDANFLITGDTRHLLPLEQIGSTLIVSPTDFYDRFVVY